MSLESYHSRPDGAQDRGRKPADPEAYSRGRELGSQARERAEREARLNRVDVSSIYWG